MADPGAIATVLLVARDDADVINGAITSLLSLEGGPLPIRVMDDGSADDTWKRLQAAVETCSGHGHDLVTTRHAETLGAERLLRAIENVDTPFVIIARAEDRSRPERVQRLLHVIETTSASVIASNRTRLGGSVIEHAGLPYQEGSGWIEPRDIAFHLAWTPTNLGTLAIRTDVVRSFPSIVGPRLGDDLGAILGFRGAILDGCFYLDETLVDFKQVREGSTFDVRSRETCREGLFSSLIASRVGMLQDLRDLRRASDESSANASLVHMEASLKGVIIELTERWTQAREELWTRDLRPCWVTETELRHANRRADMRRPKSIVTRMKDALSLSRTRRAA